jgi:hypothetical protein
MRSNLMQIIPQNETQCEDAKASSSAIRKIVHHSELGATFVCAAEEREFAAISYSMFSESNLPTVVANIITFSSRIATNE